MIFRLLIPFFPIPDDNKLYFDIFLQNDKKLKLLKNKKVAVSIVSWETNKKNPVGNVIQVLGVKGEASSEINSSLLNNNFSSSFPKEVLKATEEIKLSFSEKEISNRLDLRSSCTFTIDPLDAKDFDDAISVEKKIIVVGKLEFILLMSLIMLKKTVL